MASMQKRLQKELLALQNDPPPGMTLNEKSVQNSITQDDHQIILFMFEHVTRIQRKQNGGIMMILVDATIIILLAEDSPTEKMSTLIIQSLNFNL
ncbi:unnamed protein product [Pipistrellus nathusii]|uniref:Uncharacterized protein n=1 Tax=Pipistrellus nathusii TaxID=59473 RepID=A0ABN9ZXX3_PIPNA